MVRENEGSLVGAGGVAGAGVNADFAVASEPTSIRWSAIFAGTVAALSLWVLLYTFGLALGLSTLEPGDSGSLKTSSIFTGVWGLVSPLIALFVGGIVAGRGARVFQRGNGAMYGLVMWGLTTLVGLWLVTSMVSSVVGSLASAGSSLVRAGGTAASSAAGQAGQLDELASSFGLNAQDAIRPLNQRLRAEGKSEVTTAQLSAVGKDVVQDAVRSGSVNRGLLIQSITQHTQLTAADAEELATSVERQIDQARAGLSQKAAQLQQGAMQAAETTGKVFWGIFGALFLGLCSAIAGGIVGVVLHLKDVTSTGGEPAYVRRRAAVPQQAR